MKRILACVLGLALLLGFSGIAYAGAVPQPAINTRAHVFRVLGYDSQYRYSGSSFVVASTEAYTYFATNYHVVEESDTLTILLHNGATIEAQVMDYDSSYDIAILRTALVLEAAPLPLYTGDGQGSGDDLVGSAIYAVGYPASGDYFLDELAYRMEDATITNGIISAVKQVTFGEKLVTLLQMNAAINSGNSGGPLVDSHGNVLGINTLGIDDTQGMFGAVSGRHLIDMLDSLAIPYTPSNSLGAISRGLSPVAVAGIALAAGLVVLCAGLAILRGRRVTLHKLLQRRLQGYTPEQALDMLRPVLQALEVDHQKGLAWGGIDQYTLYLYADGNLALSKPLPWQKQDAAFKPVELYDDGVTPGIYSDVYALGIALYCLLSNQLPQNALHRLQEDTLPEDIAALALPEALEQALLQATLLDQEARTHDVHALQEVLGLLEEAQQGEEAPACLPAVENVVMLPLADAITQMEAEATGEETDQLPVWMQAAVAAKAQLEEQLAEGGEKELEATVFVVPVPVPMAEQECDTADAQPQKKSKTGRYALLGIVAVAALLGGAFLLINGKYHRAETLAAQWSFAEAEQALSGVPEVFRDTRRLRRYVEAGAGLEAQDYAGAKEWFGLLGPYRDAQMLVEECDYRQAEQLLLGGEFHAAQALFTSLLSYRDAADRALECDFRRAEQLLAQDAYDEAATLFDMLASKEFLNAREMRQEVDYRRALELMEQQAHEEAFMLLRDMPYYKDAGEKLALLQEWLYVEAEQAYAEKQLAAEDVLALFQRVPAYGEAPQYLAYIQLSLDERELPQPADRDYAGWQNFYYQSYLRRLAFWEFAPAQAHILQSYFNEFLYGRWEGEGKYFEVAFDEKTGYVSYSMNFSGGRGKGVLIENQVFRTTGDGGRTWGDGLRFTVIDQGTMDVFCFADSKTYRMVRQ